MYKTIKKGKYDAVHIHKNSCANPMAFIVAKMAGVPKIIAHSHNTAPTIGKIASGAHFLFRPIVYKTSTVHLACSKAAADWLFGKENHALVVKNGIDLDKFSVNEDKRKKMRDELGVGDALVFGHVGNFILQKNHKFMVEIMAEVIKTEPTAKMLFIGYEYLIKEVKQYAKQCGVDDNILFLGSRSDVDCLYQAMDTFLFPSLHEGFPIAGLEAQAAGLPCLFSDAITSEIIVTENAEKMSLEKSAAEWAERLIELAKNGHHLHTTKQIANAGYDAFESTRLIEQIYVTK